MVHPGTSVVILDENCKGVVYSIVWENEKEKELFCFNENGEKRFDFLSRRNKIQFIVTVFITVFLCSADHILVLSFFTVCKS